MRWLISIKLYMLLKRTLLLLFSAMCLVVQAQKNTDEELAAQYFNNGEFDKAAILYEDLLDKKPESPYYYDNLFTCYFKLKDLDKAEKMVKRQKRRFSSNFYFRVDLGYIYQQQGEKKKAEEEFKDCIKDLKPAQEQVTALSNAFIKREQFDYAIEAIMKGRKMFNDDYVMAFELAELYKRKGDKLKMITEYLNYLQRFETELDPIQNQLLEHLTGEEDWKLLKKEILSRVQGSSQHLVFNELLMWLLVQQKDFYGAFIQFKALDRRQKEDGRRLIDLADISLSNDAPDVALECYKYVVGLGEDKLFYHDARNGLLTVSYKKITEYGEYDSAFLAETEKNYRQFIDEVGVNYISAPAMRQLAHLYSHYSNKPEESIALLERVITVPNVQRAFTAECKLELGDAYLVSGDIWEAQLLYGQVDKDFKDEPLGQEAKFRNARLSFYKGEFDWAQAQLDVLKSATSHLISNNAIELSLLIQDNYGFEDGDDSALLLYAEADLYLLRNMPDQALQKLDSIKLKFPFHSLNDELLLTEARIYKKKKQYKKALEMYNLVVTAYAFDILADNALFEMAELYERQMGEKEKAKELYEKIIVNYSSSIFANEARKRFRRLRGDGVQDIPKDAIDYKPN